MWQYIYIYNIGLSEKNYYLEHKEPEGSLYGPEALFFLDGKLTSLPPSSLTHLPPCAVHVFSLFCTALYMYLREIEQPVVVLTGSRLCVPCMCVCVCSALVARHPLTLTTPLLDAIDTVAMHRTHCWLACQACVSNPPWTGMCTASVPSRTRPCGGSPPREPRCWATGVSQQHMHTYSA